MKFKVHTLTTQALVFLPRLPTAKQMSDLRNIKLPYQVRFQSIHRLIFRLLSTFDPVSDLEFHHMETHHGKEPLDDVDGSIKNQVINEDKFRRLTESTSRILSEGRQSLVPPITPLYLPINDLLDEPVHVTKISAIPKNITNAQINDHEKVLIDRNKIPNKETPYIVEF